MFPLNLKKKYPQNGEYTQVKFTDVLRQVVLQSILKCTQNAKIYNLLLVIISSSLFDQSLLCLAG